ncbi:AraC family ligand binding domain-containing protein [Streptomyces chartreusis]|uniref:AraC family ligand binding domain-containing protein n=1 Tax=Streptomyces chartreusis TaxID=1969 RepID=UPI00368FFC59
MYRVRGETFPATGGTLLLLRVGHWHTYAVARPQPMSFSRNPRALQEIHGNMRRFHPSRAGVQVRSIFTSTLRPAVVLRAPIRAPCRAGYARSYHRIEVGHIFGWEVPLADLSGPDARPSSHELKADDSGTIVLI